MFTGALPFSLSTNPGNLGLKQNFTYELQNVVSFRHVVL